MAFTLSRTRADDLARAQDPDTPATELMSLSLHRDPSVRAIARRRLGYPVG